MRAAKRPFHAGHQVECPCCGSQFRAFARAGIPSRPNAECLACGALERHRLEYLYLRNETPLFSGQNHKVLHVAPEPALRRVLASAASIRYVTADLMAHDVDVRMDVTSIPFPDGSFDFILCNHVLEHVPDDRRAMREFHRVLSPDGQAILQVPISMSRVSTFEDSTATKPRERERLFGQYNHVRRYGRDIVDRLLEVGFTVNVEEYGRRLKPELVQRHRLQLGDDYFFVCSRS
jgi:SAM-dependent methyltransferase